MEKSLFIPPGLSGPDVNITERRRLLKAAGGSLAIHVALFAVAAAWSGGERHIPSRARIITVEISEFVLPAVQARAPEKVSLPRPVRTVARPAPAPVAPAASLAHSPVTPPAATPAPVGVSSLSQTVSPVRIIPSAESARVVPEGASMAAPPSVLPAGPTQAASATSPPATPSRGSGGYLALCRGLIEKNKNYPVMARKGRVEGTVTVSCVLARDGSIRQSGIVRTSGSTLLDNAALRAVRSVGQFPPLPTEIHSNELSLEVPIAFRLTAD